jgi:hypothetical protein
MELVALMSAYTLLIKMLKRTVAGSVKQYDDKHDLSFLYGGIR